MKFLVLSCNTGQGHNSAAKAVCERLTHLGHECDFKDTLRYCSKSVSESICNSYDKIVLHTPRAFGIGYKYSKSIIYKGGKKKSAVYALNMSYSKRLYRDIIKNKYDAVICTHVFPAQSVTHAKHKHGLDVPVYVIATDYSLSPFYDELDVTKFFVSMKEVVHEYTDRGIPEEMIVPSGIPVSERFSLDISKSDAREILGLPSDRFICLIMSGSMGFGNIYELIDKIIERPVSGYDIIVITGNNTKLRMGITEKYSHYSNIGAIGYTDKVHLFMKSADLIITKPGGLSSTEAMVCGVPLILTNPIPGCETENYRLLTDLGAAIGGKEIDKAVYGFESVLINKKVGDELVYHQKKYINANSTKTICECILNDLTQTN